MNEAGLVVAIAAGALGIVSLILHALAAKSGNKTEDNTADIIDKLLPVITEYLKPAPPSSLMGSAYPPLHATMGHYAHENCCDPLAPSPFPMPRPRGLPFVPYGSEVCSSCRGDGFVPPVAATPVQSTDPSKSA